MCMSMCLDLLVLMKNYVCTYNTHTNTHLHAHITYLYMYTRAVTCIYVLFSHLFMWCKHVRLPIRYYYPEGLVGSRAPLVSERHPPCHPSQLCRRSSRV